MDIPVNPCSLVIAPKFNTVSRKTGKMKKDGREFQSQAKQFMKKWGIPDDNLLLFDNSKPKQKKKQRDEVLAFIEAKGREWCVERRDEDRQIAVAFFCHGYSRGIQCGFDLSTVDDLAESISEYGGDEVRVPLYACDTARDLDRDRKDDLEQFGGDGGFADELRDALCEAEAIFCRVDAHTTAGHTTRNPNDRRFEGQGSAVGGHGGYYIVPFPTKELLDGLTKNQKRKRREAWSIWRKALRTTFRFSFPFMTTAEIHETLLV